MVCLDFYAGAQGKECLDDLLRHSMPYMVMFLYLGSFVFSWDI
jgi:hypothetical protein